MVTQVICWGVFHRLLKLIDGIGKFGFSIIFRAIKKNSSRIPINEPLLIIINDVEGSPGRDIKGINRQGIFEMQFSGFHFPLLT